jgi:hypothetical protein
MPSGTRVDDCYQRLRRQGHSEESAARICQSSTGESLQTGRKPKKQKLTRDEEELNGPKRRA